MFVIRLIEIYAAVDAGVFKAAMQMRPWMYADHVELAKLLALQYCRQELMTAQSRKCHDLLDVLDPTTLNLYAHLYKWVDAEWARFST